MTHVSLWDSTLDQYRIQASALTCADNMSRRMVAWSGDAAVCLVKWIRCSAVIVLMFRVLSCSSVVLWNVDETVCLYCVCLYCVCLFVDAAAFTLQRGRGNRRGNSSRALITLSVSLSSSLLSWENEWPSMDSVSVLRTTRLPSKAPQYMLQHSEGNSFCDANMWHVTMLCRILM